MGSYNSKYYTCEEIDQRLLQGYYDDAKKQGYEGTKEDFQKALASNSIYDLSIISSTTVITGLQQAINLLDSLVINKSIGIILKCTIGDAPKTYEYQGGNFKDIKSWLESSPSDINLKLHTLRENTTSSINGLQQQIDGIVANNAKLTLSASPATVYENESTAVIVTATLSGSLETITILKGSAVLTRADNASKATATDTVTTTTTYTAKATVKGRDLTATAKVSAYLPIFFGPAANYDEVLNVKVFKQSPRSTPYDHSYTATVQQGYSAVFAIPESMPFNPKDAKEGGFVFPLDLVSTEGGYKYYQSGEFEETKTIKVTIKEN